MSRLNVLLLIVLMVSSMALVRSSYETRRLFAAVERGRSEERQLNLDAVRLRAEIAREATHLKVEQVARSRLQMRMPLATDIVFVSAEAAEAAASAPAATGGAR